MPSPARHVWVSFTGAFLIAIAWPLPAQENGQAFQDPAALLKTVAKHYALGADTFRLESITETSSNSELRREWRKVYRMAIQGSGKRYRIETRSPFGSYVQVSDGENELVYQIEGSMYVKRPTPENWPQFGRLIVAGSHELRQAWDMRIMLESTVVRLKNATMLPDETIRIADHAYPCYVVHAADSIGGDKPNEQTLEDVTLWIDKSALVLRKYNRHANSYLLDSGNPDIRIPFVEDSTTVYPVAELNLPVPDSTFLFTPPDTAKQVTNLESGAYMPLLSPKTSMVGEAAPEISFVSGDNAQIPLSGFRGRPVLLDLWATWCGPCLVSMPAFQRLYRDFKDKGVAFITVDQDPIAEDAGAYLARYEYRWTNYHDEGGRILKAFKAEGVPLTILVDANGKIVYYEFGGDEAGVRKVLTALTAR